MDEKQKAKTRIPTFQNSTHPKETARAYATVGIRKEFGEYGTFWKAFGQKI
jgi:hypothetical protein